jgi:Skp family chaperone for outer membrane proteins
MANHDLTPWIGIARAGTFQDSQGREHTFTETDLEAIRAGYDPAQSEAPLVFGHPKDNGPAYGWVHALKREGAKLFAQFAHVPAEVRKLVQDGRYRYVSMSLAPDKRRLLHVGLLGAAAPAIDGLGPVELNTDGVTINFASEEGNMTVEELQRRVGELEAQLKAAQEEKAKLAKQLADSDKGKDDAEKGKKDAEEKASKAAADFAAYKGEVEGGKRAARVRTLVNDGKLEPAKEQETISFAATLGKVTEPVNFAAPDGKTEQITAEERYFRELEARPVDPRFANFSAPAPAHFQSGEGARAVQADITKLL